MMTWDEEACGYRLSSGRFTNIDATAVSSDPDVMAYAGTGRQFYRHVTPMTPEERREFAEYMIARWRAWLRGEWAQH
jgi:hypothetical protein